MGEFFPGRAQYRPKALLHASNRGPEQDATVSVNKISHGGNVLVWMVRGMSGVDRRGRVGE